MSIIVQLYPQIMDIEELLERTNDSENVEDAISYIKQNTDSLMLKKKSNISTGETTYATYLVFDLDQEYEVNVYNAQDSLSAEVTERNSL